MAIKFVVLAAVLAVPAFAQVKGTTRSREIQFELRRQRSGNDTLTWFAAFSSEADTAPFGIKLHLPSKLCCHRKTAVQGIFERQAYDDHSLILFDLAKAFQVDFEPAGSGSLDRAEMVTFTLTLDSTAVGPNTSGFLAGDGIIAGNNTQFRITLDPRIKKGTIIVQDAADAKSLFLEFARLLM